MAGIFMKIILLMIFYVFLSSQNRQIEFTYSNISKPSNRYYENSHHLNVKYLLENKATIKYGIDISFSNQVADPSDYVLKIGIPISYSLYNYKTFRLNGGMIVQFSNYLKKKTVIRSFLSFTPQINIYSALTKNIGIAFNFNYSFNNYFEGLR